MSRQHWQHMLLRQVGKHCFAAASSVAAWRDWLSGKGTPRGVKKVGAKRWCKRCMMQFYRHTCGPRLPALLECMALWLGALASALPKLSAAAWAKLSEDASVARLAVDPPCSNTAGLVGDYWPSCRLFSSPLCLLLFHSPFATGNACRCT